MECADYVICNKTDMLKDKAQLEQLISIVSSLNPLSTVIPCEQGKVRAGNTDHIYHVMSLRVTDHSMTGYGYITEVLR